MVLNQVTGIDFENECVRTNYQPSKAYEANLHARIARLVERVLKDHPPIVTASPPPRQGRAQQAVIPSIEDRLGRYAPAELNGYHDFEQELDEEYPVQSSRRNKNNTKIGQRLQRPQAHHPRAASPVSPQRLRARVKAKQWQSGRIVDEDKRGALKPGNKWFGLSERPYLPRDERDDVLKHSHLMRLEDDELLQPSTIHVDFSQEECQFLQGVARKLYGSKSYGQRSTMEDLRHLLKRAKRAGLYSEFLTAKEEQYASFDMGSPPTTLLSRNVRDIHNFASDICKRKLRPEPAQVFTIARDDLSSRVSRINRAPSLLLAREILGNRPPVSTRRYESFNTSFKTNHEDALEPQIEWTNCAGDIMALSWVSDTQFVCGTTTHSDSHNQQYNKPGNLLLGSSSQKTLRAYPDHRIPRPVVLNGDNALDAMVESQDPWLFSSVVDSDFDPVRKLAFTASFDGTVRIWRVDDNAMACVGTWEHGGRVNFVLASNHRHGLVATAADVATGAVRVYHTETIQSNQAFDSYSCTKVDGDHYVPSDKWAYFPAAIRWGLAPVCQHLLLVGYSPRSLTGHDLDIPRDKLSTGELCLWDTLQRRHIKVNSLVTQNVFEVTWHPFRNAFAVATSEALSIERNDHNVNTQIRIFEMNVDGQYGAIKTLDCTAVDINELVIRPNSVAFSYIAAGCTDGNCYVWDTAGSDLPICVLRHGEPVEELLGEKELEDVGVKFVSWGTTADRLYTGSSDGVVKVWNIRHGKAVHLRDLIEVPGPITAGSFSPDHSKLAIGDGSGRVYLLGLEDDEEGEQTIQNGSDLVRMQLGGQQRAIRRPRPFIPHPEVPPPNRGRSAAGSDLTLGRQRAGEYLQRGEIVLHPHPCIGAIKGPRYSDTGLFRAEAHLDEDVSKPLLAMFERHQQEPPRLYVSPTRMPRVRAIEGYGNETANMLRYQNTWTELSSGRNMDELTRAQLEAEGIDCDSDYDYEYESGREDEDEDADAA
ncbi:hypothetical protein KJ359_002209 [Pestalotiopsis sp. 9143b]|nr:hypothetical protein KJ359_002209 [Pestalotiopsis sp. 9143b]